MSDDLMSMAARLAELKELREELEGKLEPIKEEAKKLGEEYINYCLENNVDGVKVNGRNVYFTTKNRASMIDDERVFGYFREHGLGHLIRESIHNATFNSTVKDLIEAGKLDIPTAESVGISIYPQRVVNIRKV